MILILLRFLQIGRARESWQIYHKALARLLVCQLSRARLICMNHNKIRIIP